MENGAYAILQMKNLIEFQSRWKEKVMKPTNPEECIRYKLRGHHCLICKDEKIEWEEKDETNKD